MRRVYHCNDAGWQSKLSATSTLRPWLQERGSLTAKLKRQYADFSVQLLQEVWCKPHADERRLLQLAADTQAWIREVWLMGNGQPRVFAHSVIARKDLRGPWYGLRKMGRSPLGAALFANPRVERGALHFRKLSSAHPLHKTVSKNFTLQTNQPLWARRSLFCLRRHHLLVTEVFLPASLINSDDGLKK
ncbi:MAG: chorismate lyase [Methylophilus sp.]|uniref:chorismate--pyruvate lyase family protein n=1 Tax=Methylophilus sp. TaxID=29541 RepID=UPI002CEDD751|nr:chorismate lyase [Methylophilus sp.]HSH85743.1 chorismate lyase [Methylophilus sp.]